MVSTFTAVFDVIISYNFSTAKLEIFYTGRLDPDASNQKRRQNFYKSGIKLELAEIEYEP